MVIHVGINPLDEEFSYYNDENKCTVTQEMIKVNPDEIDKIQQLYKEIISKINGTPGCICIDLSWRYGNQIRKKFIKEGLKCGFKNVEIINYFSSLFFNAMSQTKYKPMNDDIIWIIKKYDVWMWKIKDQKGICVYHDICDCANLSDLKKLVSKSQLNKGPNVAFYRNEYDDALHKIEVYETQISKISDCKFFIIYNVYNYSNGCLIKARLTAGDRDFFHIDAVNVLSEEVDVYLENRRNEFLDLKEMMIFPKFQHLPINHSQIFKKNPKFQVLTVKSGFLNEEVFVLPSYKKINMTFKMDINGIFTVLFNEYLSDIEAEDSASKSFTKKLKSFFFQTPSTSTSCYTIPKCLTQLSPTIDAIGIDLGTSRCCAAVSRKNGITTVPLDNTGERLLPSYVAYDEKNVKCGQVVISRLRHHSKSTIFDSKRIIGKHFNDIEINDIWDFSVCHENEKIFLEVNGFNEKKKLSAEEVAAELLKLIKQKTEEFQGRHLSQAVITIPAAFSESQTASTKEAAKNAQWQSVHLLPEPVAAAFAYFVDRQILKNSNVLVFDLGGGTLDVCIFKIENNQIRIISNTGDTNLGGRDFDTVLINYFKNILLTKYGISKIRDKNYKLMLECQRIKEELSTAMNSSLDVDEIDSNQEGSISITREEFEKMTSQLLNKIKNTIHAALYHSKYEANQINKVLQVGGGSRMPMIKDLLKEIFPQADHICEEHPDEVVAVGAAYYAYNIFSK